MRSLTLVVVRLTTVMNKERHVVQPIETGDKACWNHNTSHRCPGSAASLLHKLTFDSQGETLDDTKFFLTFDFIDRKCDHSLESC